MQILLSTSLDSFFELISVLLIFVFVLFITWFATRYMANFQKTKFANNNMQVIETVQVGNNKYLSLVSIGEIYLVVSVGKDEVNLVTQLTKEQLPELKLVEMGTPTSENFQDVLTRMKDLIPKK